MIDENTGIKIVVLRLFLAGTMMVIESGYLFEYIRDDWKEEVSKFSLSYPRMSFASGVMISMTLFFISHWMISCLLNWIDRSES